MCAKIKINRNNLIGNLFSDFAVCLKRISCFMLAGFVILYIIRKIDAKMLACSDEIPSCVLSILQQRDLYGTFC